MLRQHPKPGAKNHSDQDWFILEYELETGETIAQRFVKHYKNRMSEDVRRLILGWGDVIESLFEVKGRAKDSLRVKNLVNEREYEVFPTASMVDLEVKPGDFLTARIVPAKGFHIFSGSLVTMRWDGSDGQRAKIYKTAIDFQMKHPDLAFKDLKSDSVSDVPFRRVAKRFPQNFNRVMAYYEDQEDFFSDRIEDLMREFKPDSFDKLPGMVTVLDSEMVRLAISAEEE